MLILESTYGDRNHEGRKSRIEVLRKILGRALDDGGIVYIPAFSLGRTQELIYEIDRIGTKAKGDHPIDFKNLYSVERFRDHKKLLEMDGPAIVIAGSGMCTVGRILDHLRHGLDYPKNDIFFVGYQAKGTPGRDIIRYSKRPGGYVKLDGEKFDIKAKVCQLTGYSAHADQKELIEWVASMPERPGKIKLVHG